MERIVLFDGVCNFCNAAVNFIIRHDTEKKFRFAPLQSQLGEHLRAECGIGDEVDSIVLVERTGDRTSGYAHSTAGLKIAKALGGVWSLAYAFIIIPPTIRNWFYRLFARYRYTLFGRRDMCMMPTPDVRERFLT